jgi:transcriptional regulator NrdR family protein
MLYGIVQPVPTGVSVMVRCPNCESTDVVPSKAYLEGLFIKTHKICNACGNKFDYKEKRI